MTAIERKAIIDAYRQQAMAAGFLASFASRRVFDTEEFELDVMREDEDVAIVLRDISNGPNYNIVEDFTNKSYKPAAYGEAGALNAHRLGFERGFGQNPFENLDFQARATARAFDVFNKLVRKMMRAGELQMAQLVTEGVIDLFAPDAEADAGARRYRLDFGPRASHFATVGTAWSGAGTPLDDVGDLAHTIRTNGRGSTEYDLICGRTALKNFITDTTVTNLLDNRRIDRGALRRPQLQGGGVVHGEISADVFNFTIWSYPNQFRDHWTTPSAPTIEPYIPDDYAVLIPRGAIFRGGFGTVQRFKPPDAAALPFLPPIMSDGLFTFSPYAWIEKDGKALTVSADSRMLFYPVTLDQFGRLDTEP